MGYNIQYGKTMVKGIIREPAANRRTPRIWLFLTACFVLTFILVNAGVGLREFLIPGYDSVTQDALTAFAEDLQAGETVKNAFAAFCMEIIENADIQQ